MGAGQKRGKERNMKRLAGAVSVFHDAIFLAILPAAIIFIAGGIVGFAVIDGGRWEEVCLKTAISAVLYILELWGFTLLGWQLFKGDCPLNLLEYSLRGLGGYTIDFWRFKSMATKEMVTAAPLAERSICPGRRCHNRLINSGRSGFALAG
jgi:hypothetical protein